MENLFDKVSALVKRRGFIFPSSDIYGGLANTWDFGPVGTLLKNNIRDLWWKRFVLDRDDMVGLDASIFLSPKVWEASGHVSNFTDALIDCKNCHFRTRADHLIEDNLKDTKVEGLPVEELTRLVHENNIKCPKCGKVDWTEVRRFNLLFESSIGIIEEGKSKVYLRGEIAQGIFINFKNVVNTSRVRVPFGIAQVGKAFRNEITLGQLVHRTLEFDLMEFEYFIKPEDWEKTFEMWRDEMIEFTRDLGLNEENLKWREHEEHERSHYSKRTMDIEYKYPFGYKEMFGIAYRTDFDLKNHQENSGKDLTYTDPFTNEKYIPHVIEPTFGLSRLVGVVLFDAYHEDGERVVLKLDPKIAPYKAAVFPLLANKPDLVERARNIYSKLRTNSVYAVWDERGNIGKRYFAQDEIGTPFCITIDFQTLEDGTVTVRDRDTAQQARISEDKLGSYLSEKLS